MVENKKYKLENLDLNTSIELYDGEFSLPFNWKENEFTYKRSLKNFTESRVFSKNIQFVGKSKEFINEAYSYAFVEANVIFTEYSLNSNLKWVIKVKGLLDFENYSSDEYKVTIPFESGLLSKKIKSKESEKIELERTTDLNGNDIESIKSNKFNLVSRPLDLNSRLEQNKEDDNNNYNVKYNVPNTASGKWDVKASLSIPLNIKYESDENVSSTLKRLDTGLEFIQGYNSTSFYSNDGIDRYVSLKIKGSCVFKKINTIFFPEAYFIIVLYYYDNNDLSKPKGVYYESDRYDVRNNDILTASVDINDIFKVDKDHSLFFGIISGAQRNRLNAGVFEADVNDINFNIDIQETSYESLYSRERDFYLNKDVGERFINIITGDKGIYKSNFFNNSEFKNTGVISGKNIRGFEDYKTTCSFKDFIKNSASLYNMAYNIENFEGKEFFRHEDIGYFFRNETIYTLSDKINLKSRKPVKEIIYSSIETGYKKPDGDNLYEEVNGLNEFNVLNTFNTILNKGKKFNNVSPWRADSEGKELTFRKNFSEYPTQDYRTDKHIFNLDLIDLGNNKFRERLYQDDFEELPKNIYSPETATGLRLTPARNMIRSFNLIKSCLTRFQDSEVSYLSSKSNSSLITKKSGENEVKEDGSFLVKDMQGSYFISEFIEFEHYVDSDFMEFINGYQIINGERVPNTYFKYEFINERGNLEKGFLFELKVKNNLGTFKILKSL